MGVAKEKQPPRQRGERLPRRFGAYHLFDRIGRGGMADIYLAHASTGLGPARRVVVKEILPALCRDERFASMLIQEAKLVSQLRHANVVQVLDLGREHERLFIAMEYVEGFDLNQLLRRLSKRRIGIPMQFAMLVVRETLAALDYAHRAKSESGGSLGVVHRDVSPSNVLISFEGEVKLCDFGIAKALSAPAVTGGHDRPSDEATGERSKIAGKAAYMSPEHARGEELDGRADLFSAGILLWELCAGRRLYKGSEERMLELAREGAVPPLPDRGLPEQKALQALLDTALAFEPRQRFQTAQAMLRALDGYAAQTRLIASQLKFGAFLSEHFEDEVVRVRRDRELAAEALDRGPPVEIDSCEPSVAEGGEAPTGDESTDGAVAASGPSDTRAAHTPVVDTPAASAPAVDAPAAQRSTIDAGRADSPVIDRAATNRRLGWLAGAVLAIVVLIGIAAWLSS